MKKMMNSPYTPPILMLHRGEKPESKQNIQSPTITKILLFLNRNRIIVNIFLFLVLQSLKPVSFAFQIKSFAVSSWPHRNLKLSLGM